MAADDKGEQPSRSELAKRVARLEDALYQNRRTVLSSLGAAGAGLLAGDALSGQARAANDSDNQIGVAGESQDLVLDQLKDPGGDQILNVDDTGAIAGQGGRTWSFPAIDTREVYTASRAADYVLQSGSPHIGVGDNSQISSDSDPAVVLQALIDDGRGTVSLDTNFYNGVASGVEIKSERHVQSRGGLDWAPDVDIRPFTLAGNAGVYGPMTVNMVGSGATGALMYLDGAPYDYGGSAVTSVKDVSFIGDAGNPEEALVKLYAGGNDRDSVTWTMWRNCRFTRGQAGTKLQAPDAGSGNNNWVNSNFFVNCYWSGNSRAIEIVRDTSNNAAAVNANRFTGGIQGTSDMNRAIYCEGESNLFELYIYDWAGTGSSTSIELTADSVGNIVRVNREHSRESGRVTDNGTRNIVNGQGVNNGDPNTTGEWNGFASDALRQQQVVVWDTSVSPNDPYIVGPDGNWIKIGS